MLKHAVQGYRISPLQSRIWLLQNADLDATYGAYCALQLEGELDERRLQSAVATVVARHEALRTTFHTLPGSLIPVQVVEDFPVEIEGPDQVEGDLDPSSLFPANGYAPRTQEGPVLWCKLFRCGPRRHLLQLRISSLCADARSLAILVGQISRAYRSDATLQSEMQEIMQYPDIAEWLNRTGESEGSEAGRKFWMDRMSVVVDSLPRLKRNAEFAGSALESMNVNLPAGTVRAVLDRDRGGRWKASAFLLAAWATLLARFGYEVSCIAISCDCRSHEILRNAIGALTRHVPTILRYSRHFSFVDVCSEAATALEEAFEWQEYFSWNDIERVGTSSDGLPFFPLSFGYLEAADPASLSGELRFAIKALHSYTDRIGLHLSCRRMASELFCELHWDGRLHSREEVSRLAANLPTLIGDAAYRSELPTGRLRIIGKSERRRIIEEFNPKSSVFPEHELHVHELFEGQASRTSDAVAVRFGQKFLTYRELNELSDRVAICLVHRGVQPETLVGVCFDRSPELVIAILGILKAGAAYVPLDPDYPADRLDFMVSDSNAEIVIISEATRDKLSVLSSERVLIGEIMNASLPPCRLRRPAAENPAYVLYTSGSTGIPKGVVISHGALRNHMGWMLREFCFVNDRVLQKTAFSFDASVWEFYAPLLTGGCLVMARPGGQRDSEYLIRCIPEEQITVLQLVPSQLEMLMQDRHFEQCANLRLVFCGGEALSMELVRKFYSLFPAARLFNLYGPTESTIDVTFDECNVMDETLTAPIGVPIANVQAYVLDEEYEPVPQGVKGDLYIGGAGLGRGYLNRPDLTAVRFVPDPFSVGPDARMYQTGDLARWLSDGRLEYLGRQDDQVKVRGFRIELGEIEAVLGQHQAVKQAVVVLREDEAGQPGLIAYIVRREDSGPVPIHDLRDYLKQSLPDYMVPPVFVELESLPLSPNGKVNRRVLPLPADSHRMSSGGGGPETAIEELVAGIWQQVLKTDRVTRGASFFELGGHSLLATQVIARVRSVFNIECPLRILFEAPTLAEFASEIEKLRGGRTRDDTLPIEPVRRDQPLPLSYAQQRVWFMEQLNPGRSVYTIPLRLRMRGALNSAALQQSFHDLVRRHEVLRTSFPMESDGPVQAIAPESSLNIETIDLSGLSGEESALREETEVRSEVNKSFNLATGPVMRVKLLKLSPQDHMLLVTMHHIVSDGWSMGIMSSEVSRLYEAYGRDEKGDSVLPPLRIQYADYAVWQRQWLQGDVLDEQLRYWQKALQGAPEVLTLATDRPGLPVASYRGAQELMSISAGLTASLKELSRSSGTTLFMTLLAGYQFLLSRYSGQDDVVVGTSIAGRRHTETEALIGMFVNMLALRGDLSGDPEFRKLLARVRETTLSAFAHQDLPFEKLVAELQLERSLGHSPVFQVIFELHNAPEESAPLSGMQVERVEQGLNIAKFDLRLSLTEVSGELCGMIEYNSDLFDPDTIRRLIRNYVVLLESAALNPAQRLSDLSMHTEAERRRLLVEWNATAFSFPGSHCVHELFEAQVRRNPVGLAIVSGAKQLTFDELNRQANRLGNHLRNQGLGPEDRVAVCLQRSPEMIVALLGILKAGAAYVPMDPACPAERLRYIMEDAQVSMLITQTSLRDRMPAVWALVLVIDENQTEIAQCPDADVESNVTSQNLAYIIYTSGSTGHPKGVGIEHQSLVNYVCWARQAYGTPEDAFDLPLYSSIAFDLTVTSIFMPLLSGGCIHVYDSDEPEAADLVIRVLRDDKTATVKLTPSHLKIIDSIANSRLNQLIVGGELLENGLARRIAEKAAAPLTIWNEYGPTETTVGCMLCKYDPAAERGSSVPIGKPAGNVRIYVLDRSMAPVPVGVPGEIYIAGVALARGYLNKPGMTAERFVPDPFAQSAGARLYRTGDRALHRTDGNLEFMGRLDGQIKLRGFRIEREEIEAVLASHPEVRHAVVVVRDDIAADIRLIGYIVPVRDANGPGEQRLMEYLRSRLPEYMLPYRIVELAEMPLTPNGKLDYNALPKPEQADAGGAELPQTELEFKLALIWEDLLKVSSFIGRKQSFFELGGHSLLAVALMSRIKEQFGQDLPLSVLFEDPTIEHLADVLRREYRPGSRVNLLPIHRFGSKPPVFFVHPLGGNGLNYILLAHLLGESQPFYSFQAIDEEDVARTTALSVEERAAQYIASMRLVQPEGPYIIGGWSWGGYIAYEIARQLESASLGVAALFLLDISAVIENELAANMDDAEFLLTHVQSNRLRFADDALDLEQKMLELSLQPVHDRSPEERLRYLIGELIRIKLLRPEVEVSQVRNYIRGCLGRAQSLLEYRIRPCPVIITLLRTAGNRLPGEEPDGPSDPMLGWGEFSPDVRVHHMPGNHFNMVFPPHIDTVAEVIRKCLDDLSRSAKAADQAAIASPSTHLPIPAKDAPACDGTLPFGKPGDY